MSEMYRRVSRFSEALRLAIYDREIEDAGHDLFFFYDADVVVDVVVGLTSWNRGDAVPETTGLAPVIHSLLTTGYLPRIYFLRPHLVEFNRVLRRLPDTPMQAGFHEDAMRYLRKSWQLPATEAELKRVVGDGDGFFQYISREGYHVFVKLELCLGGHWKRRLMRLAKDGFLNLLSPGGSDLPRLGDTVARDFAEGIEFWRSDPRAALSNQVDAHALAELHRKVNSGLSVRFYTETDPVRAVSMGTEKLLDSQGRSVLRNEEYFLMRSSFRALAFDIIDGRKRIRRSDAGPPRDFDSLATLRELRDALEEVLAGSGDQDDPVLEEALRSRQVCGVNLGELVEGFYKLNFLDTVFLSWEPPTELQNWLPSLYEMKSQEDMVVETRQRVMRSLTALWQDMEKEIGQLRDWREDFNRISKAAAERAQQMENHLPDLWVDLGLGRWGLEFTLSEQVAERIRYTIKGLMDDPQARNSICSDLSIQYAYTPQTLDDFIHLVCILWFLRLDAMLRTAFETAPMSVRKQINRALNILYHVALVRTVSHQVRNNRTLHDKLQNIVQLTERNAEQSAGEDQVRLGFAFMGVAHVCYWAWREASQETSGKGLEWAHKSFEAARKAERNFEAGTLAWAFAVNHCAYMGVRTRLFREETDRYMEMLIKRIPRAHEHYRFADTIAWGYTAKVEDEIERHGVLALATQAEFMALRKELCQDLVVARRILREVVHFGDVEVTDHLKLISKYKSWLQCRRMRGPSGVSSETAPSTD